MNSSSCNYSSKKRLKNWTKTLRELCNLLMKEKIILRTTVALFYLMHHKVLSTFSLRDCLSSTILFPNRIIICLVFQLQLSFVLAPLKKTVCVISAHYNNLLDVGSRNDHLMKNWKSNLKLTFGIECFTRRQILKHILYNVPKLYYKILHRFRLCRKKN